MLRGKQRRPAPADAEANALYCYCQYNPQKVQETRRSVEGVVILKFIWRASYALCAACDLIRQKPQQQRQ